MVNTLIVQGTSYGVSLLLSIGCSKLLFHITAILRLVDPIISVGQGCGGL